MLVVKAPWWFGGVWLAISNVMSRGSREKPKVLGANYLPTLLELVDASQVTIVGRFIYFHSFFSWGGGLREGVATKCVQRRVRGRSGGERLCRKGNDGAQGRETIRARACRHTYTHTRNCSVSAPLHGDKASVCGVGQTFGNDYVRHVVPSKRRSRRFHFAVIPPVIVEVKKACFPRMNGFM